jgi:hypothetical protein
MVDNPADILKPRIKYTPKVNPNLLLHAEDLLSYYSFDLGGRSAQMVLQEWAQDYPVPWIRLAIIEALYQGRYKAISVGQILQIWARREQVQTRFDAEFEKLICEKLPRKMLLESEVDQESAIAAIAAEIHATNTATNGAESSQEAALAALARVVQNRKPLQPGVNAVINHLEADVAMAAEQGKQQVLGESPPAAEQPENGTHPPTDPKSIHQFQPNPANPDLFAKLKAVAIEPKNQPN